MSSVFAHLFGTLPFRAAVATVRERTGIDGYDLPMKDLAGAMNLVKASVKVAPPPVPDEADEILDRRLWQWDISTSAPNQVDGITCRVRETGYRRYLVLDKLEWGNLRSGVFQPVVLITSSEGTFELPLTGDYVHSQWMLWSARLKEGSDSLYPLETHLDYADVRAFAYDLTGGVKKYTPDPATDTGEAEIAGFGGKSTADAEGNRWLARACKGGFMPLPASSDVATLLDAEKKGKSTTDALADAHAKAVVDTKTTLATTPLRALVVLSLTAGRERADFEPGSLVGMGRLFPHVYVRASFPVSSIHMSIRFTRPKRTTVYDKGNGTVTGTCCSALEDIGALLVADSNDDPYGPDNAFKPFWSGTFAYYELDPDKRLKDKALHVVRRDRPYTRTEESCGKRILPLTPQNLTSIEKLPRQGEFDNIHVSPRLKLVASPMFRVEVNAGLLAGTVEVDQPFDPKRMKLDSIAMAPFCSHDCFHMHWRWLPESAHWVKGWGPSGPHTESGAPMTPPNHDVFLTFHGPNVFTYSEDAYPTAKPSEDKTEEIPALSMQVFAYPGAAYAQGVVSWRESAAKNITAAMAIANSDVRHFLSPDGATMTSADSPPVLYWNLRYSAEIGADGEFEAVERIQMTTAEVDRARKR